MLLQEGGAAELLNAHAFILYSEEISESRESTMVQVKEAVQRAQSYLPEVFGYTAGKEMRLEGVELSDDTKFWIVTFSYLEMDMFAGALREYKTVKLRAEDGEFFGARNGLPASGLP